MDASTDLLLAAARSIPVHYPEFLEVGEPEWRHFLACLRPRSYERGESLQQQGEPAHRIHYLLQGVVCLRTLHEDAVVNLGFDGENRWVGSYASLLSGAPCAFGVVALEPCTTVLLQARDLLALYDRHPVWDRVGRLMVERALLTKERKEYERWVLSPAERYDRFVREHRWFVDRVPQYELARFLGVAPETLSRIRARCERSPRS